MAANAGNAGGFNGFFKETVTFFEEIKENNSKQWFNANKERYETKVLEPSRAFVIAMGERLETISPDIKAIPKVDKSLFRIFRDTRFSKNKSPYKIHMGIFFWEGDAKKLECPGFYFHLEPPTIFMGGGFHIFPKWFLEPYREAVADPKSGKKLLKILEPIAAKNYTLSGSHYKRVPRGFDPEHPNAELLKHKGLFGSFKTEIPEVFYSAELVDYCFEVFKDMAPLQRWMVDVVNSR
ncbi:MAG: DUF2461 domain-containing protein [bacterium]|nr:DUF2461 domain-containing protein [bacterium]